MLIPADLIEVGYVTDAYGLNGWVKIKPHATEPDALLKAKTWWLTEPRTIASRAALPGNTAESLNDFAVMQSKMHSGSVVAQLMGVADRSLAEKLKGSGIYISRAHFPATNQDEFYWVDLVGCHVQNERQESLGQVDHLIDHGAHPTLVITYQNADNKTEERLIPFVDAYIKQVDIKNHQIIVDWELDY
ncbi:ribosome maturation factor RimM [Ampullimonas aquatilis]|uniref:ribosome maturation factor RimM n=1 Tax=Ampullimonas aquatilis TaxID=1341549 RepID=UPI003C715B2C